ncbi:hypothetical protein C2S51_037759 [Perilla frutescens var. frutescens]|nr:hypothetical protein C2S51_037759 [Perilla frutescens var. frutescens]
MHRFATIWIMILIISPQAIMEARHLLGMEKSTKAYSLLGSSSLNSVAAVTPSSSANAEAAAEKLFRHLVRMDSRSLESSVPSPGVGH